MVNLIKNVVVYGSGLMGRGIAQVAATSGYKVTLVDISQDALAKAQSQIKSSLERIAKKTNDNHLIDKTMANINCSVNADGQEGDLYIEAIIENLEKKQALLKKVEEGAPKQAILATNTSSLSVKDISKNLNKKDRFAGLHFFNPVPMMKLVEIVKTDQTDEKVLSTLVDFTKSLNKVPVVCKDTPGFIVNRLLIPYLVEAVKLYEEGVASKEDIDIAIKLGLGYPMGPFELLDYVGLDTTLSIIKAWETKLNLPVVKSIKELVEQGKLGNKSGEGFHKVTNNK
jgi:3-hydroxyacyl-CoA dehydrogenase